MRLQEVMIQNFKVLKDVCVELNDDLSIIVGDNEAGKTTLLEAIDLVLSGNLNGRSIAHDIHPYLFNQLAVAEYFAALDAGESPAPPFILIEAYFDDDLALADFRGSNNARNKDATGIALRIEPNEAFRADFDAYLSQENGRTALPVEYYCVNWRAFSNAALVARSVPIKSLMVDTNATRTLTGADHYIARIINEVLTIKERVGLTVTYRQLKTDFLDRPEIKSVNKFFADRQGEISDKPLAVSVDISSRSTWETNLTPYLANIPFTHTGKGEQSSVKMKLALTAKSAAHIFLIEEPENHLSYTNMSRLIDKVSQAAAGKQVVIATHSSFVLNKLGADKVILFTGKASLKLRGLSDDTRDYFMKLPGHDTLRLILARRAILVEGPSDELIVQRAYLDTHGVSPMAHGVDVISVKSLAFKRFLDIAKLLNIDARVVTDNDGDVAALEAKYDGYLEYVHYDKDETYRTLEPQLLKANSLAVLNLALGKAFASEDALIKHMTAPANKTDCALQIFRSVQPIKYPQYILDAIKE